jgi:hypothetical protein
MRLRAAALTTLLLLAASVLPFAAAADSRKTDAQTREPAARPDLAAYFK